MPPEPDQDFADSPAALFVADRAGRLLRTNSALDALVASLGEAGARLAAGVAELAPEPGTTLRREVTAPGDDGDDRVLEVIVVATPTACHGTVVDLTERRRREAALHHRATHDPLTGLPRRTLFKQRLAQALAHAGRDPGYVFAVLFLDLDRFKAVNDSFGHATGDLLLRAVAERVRGCLRRAGDTAARFGGDELVVLLDDLGEPRRAAQVAEGILEELHRPFDLEGHEIFTGASIGIVVGSAAYGDGDELLRDADTAMYRAKRRGRGGYEIFDRRMQEEAVRLSTLELELRAAVERQSFELAYQPIVGIASADVLTFEALLRWRGEDGALLLPERFMSLAEESGLIVRLGQWALRQACRRAKAWRAAGLPMRVAINLSSRQFKQPDLVDQLRSALGEHDLDADALEVEVTESSLLEDPEATDEALTALRELGVRLAVDNFGVGCFSLSHLKRLPVDVVKIDRTLLAEIPDHGGDAAIVKAVIDLGHSLGLRVIAEGIEDERQVAFLRAHGCDAAQGHYFERPLGPAALDELLDHGVGTPRRLRLPGHDRISVAAVGGPPAGVPHAAAVAASVGLAGLSIVLVEDEDDARDALAALLELHGASVATASSAVEAVALVRRLRPDVLVSDIGLPGDDGYELIRRIRQLPATSGGAVPAVALTGYSRSADRVEALQAGYQTHTSKPIQPAELIAVIASLAGGTRGPQV